MEIDCFSHWVTGSNSLEGDVGRYLEKSAEIQSRKQNTGLEKIKTKK